MLALLPTPWQLWKTEAHLALACAAAKPIRRVQESILPVMHYCSLCSSGPREDLNLLVQMLSP